MVFVAGCDRADPPAPPVITVMAFNVENLFDNVDDPGKEDRDYLPLAAKQNDAHREACAAVEVERWRMRCLTIDWTDEVIEKKLARVAASILQVGDGRGPDIVALQEVENLAILERLRLEYLAAADYLPGILIEGWDNRGIDVAFLSRLPLAGEPILHDIEFDAEFADRRGDTRGLLQADFRMPDGSLLTGYSVHFPAPFHPTAMRVAAFETLNARLAELPADRAVFAAGDFNTTSREDTETGMIERMARPAWIVSNDLCDGCRGTAYFAPDDTWSFLDMVLWRPCCGEKATWDLRANPVRIANGAAEQVTPDGTPWRFDPATGRGVSDHWPVVISLELK